MNKKANRLLSAALAVVFATTVSAAAASPILAHPEAKSVKVLKWFGLEGTTWPQTLDPAEIEDSISYDIANQTQANLMTLEPDGSIAPTPGHPANCWTKCSIS